MECGGERGGEGGKGEEGRGEDGKGGGEEEEGGGRREEVRRGEGRKGENRRRGGGQVKTHQDEFASLFPSHHNLEPPDAKINSEVCRSIIVESEFTRS